MNYTLVKRIDDRPNIGENDIGSHDRNYNLPMIGFHDYEKSTLLVNDVIGIQLKNVLKSQCKAIPLCLELFPKIICEPMSIECDYNIIEEHLFKIIKIDDVQYEISPILIDDYKIISKQVKCEFNSEVKVSINNMSNYELFKLYATYIRKFEITFWSDNQRYYQLLTDELINDDPNTKNLKYLLRKCRMYNDLVFDENNEIEKNMINYYFDVIRRYSTKIIELFDSDTYHKLGSYNTLCDNNKNVYNQIISTSPNYLIFNDNFIYTKQSSLNIPKILHNIKTIKHNEIYRVYKTDTRTMLLPSDRLTDWYGNEINENIVYNLSEGNIVRVLLCYEKYQSCAVYCVILKKISKYRYLVSIVNMYLSKYENIVFVINSNSIIEIPLDWSENIGLSVYSSANSMDNNQIDDNHLRYDDLFNF